jgi:membrane-bound ClpP family serine protease
MNAVMTIAAMAVICMLLELLMPKSALKSSITVIIGIAFLLTAAVPIIGLINHESPSGIQSAADFNGTEQRELQPYQDFLSDLFKNIE